MKLTALIFALGMLSAPARTWTSTAGKPGQRLHDYK